MVKSSRKQGIKPMKQPWPRPIVICTLHWLAYLEINLKHNKQPLPLLLVNRIILCPLVSHQKSPHSPSKQSSIKAPRKVLPLKISNKNRLRVQMYLRATQKHCNFSINMSIWRIQRWHSTTINRCSSMNSWNSRISSLSGSPIESIDTFENYTSIYL